MRKQFLCARHDLIRVHFPGKLKLVKQLCVIAVKTGIAAKHATVMSVTHPIAEREIMALSQTGEEAFGITAAQGKKNRTVSSLPFEYGIFKSKPEKCLVNIRVFVVLKRTEQRLDPGIIIVTTDCAYHSVPIQIGVTILVICLKIRRKSMALRRIPNHVFRSPPLQFVDLVHQAENRSSAESMPEIRAERMSDTI